MKLLDTARRALRVHPLDARFVVDDALVLAWNAYSRAKERTLPSATKALLARNASLRDLHRGQRCWILGNGTSLNEQDLKRLRGEHTFVVNRFIHHPEAEAIDPKYYVIVDPKFGNGTWGESFIADIEARVPRVRMFTGSDGHRFLESRGLLTHHERHVVFPNQLYAFGYDHDIDLTRGIPGQDNVTKTALSIAVWMGFTRINLLGIDGDGILRTDQTHFYGSVPRPAEQAEFEKSLMSSAMGMRSWRSAVSYLARRGVRLVSMNPRSVLTGIPTVPFEV